MNILANWNTVSRLLDEALELDVDARTGWLDALRRAQPDVVPALEKLLAAHAHIETAQMLRALPVLDPAHAGSAARDDGAPRTLFLSAPARLEADTFVGPYRLIRELGVGGMAHVWLAARADGAFERDIALKLPQVSLLRRHLAERFARERDILARLEHPHIARLYDAGVAADGTPYLAMEFVAGQPLHTYCDERKLDISARLALFDQVLAAVQYAHANLVIHRDLKPSNILVDEQGQVRLLDFGIAKLVADDDSAADETQLTQAGGRAMTLQYASPEQVRGQALTTASDIYALGVLLCELLSGHRPYRLEIQSAAQLEIAIVMNEPARPSTLVDAAAAGVRGTTPARLTRALAGDLDTIVGKSLAKVPGERYATVAELAADLRRHAQGEPVLARPASWSYRARKFVVRNRLAVGAAAAVLVAVLGGAGAALHQARVAREQATRAEDVKRLVLSIFESAEPTAGGSRKTSAIELLAQARSRIAKASLADAGTRVELSTSIAMSMILLGELGEAIALMEDTVAVAVRELPAADLRRAAAEHTLGRALAANAQGKRARPLLDASEATFRQHGEAAAAPLTEALRWKAAVLTLEGRMAEAADAAREGLTIAESLPPEFRDRAVLRLSVALAQTLNLARQPGGRVHAERGLALAEKLHGNRASSIVFTARGVFATALRNDGEFELAERELRKALEDVVELLGPDHGEVGTIHTQLGHVAWRRGDTTAALAAFQAALRVQRATTGDTPSRPLAVAYENLAATQVQTGNYADSERTLDRLAEIVAQLDPEIDVARTSRTVRVRLYTATGRLKEADALMSELLARPAGSSWTVAAARNVVVGPLRLAQGRYDEADAALSAAAADLAKDPRFVIERARALTGLGTARLRAGRTADALGPLEQAVALYRKHQIPTSRERLDAEAALMRAQTTAASR